MVFESTPTFGHSSSPPPGIRGKQLQMYNALNWPDYNLKTQELMQKQDGCQVIIATDILMVGVDFPDIDNVVIISHPPHTNDYIQKIRHAGRDHTLVPNPRGIIYVTSHAISLAHKQLEGTKKPTGKKGAKKKHKTSGKGVSLKSSMSKPMAELIIANCKTALLDRLYKNPQLGKFQCNYSSCAPEPKASKQQQKRGMHYLTKEMRELATKKFIALRKKIFIEEALLALTDPFFVLS